MQARLGWTNEEMQRDPDATFAAYADTLPNSQQIRVHDSATLSKGDVERALDKTEPGLIILDQLRKVKGFDKMGEGQDKLEAQFQWARELAKAYAPVIVVHQLGELAEGKKWCSMDMLYGSKTALQGEPDLIINMGRTYDTGNRRYLFLPKNKLQTPGDPALRNGKFVVEILPDIARYEDVPG